MQAELKARLVDFEKYPYVIERNYFRSMIDPRRDLLRRLELAYSDHDLEVDQDDEMWGGLAGNDDDSSVSWHRHHYMFGGRSALKAMIMAMMATGRAIPSSILDFPSSHGRVTRFLVKAFPEAEVWAGDVNRAAVDYCEQAFGARPIYSSANLRSVRFGRKFDLIWCGSLATHLDEDKVIDLLDLLTGALEEDGLLGITTCGRGMVWAHQNSYKTIDDVLFEQAHERYLATGFGYVDYPGASGYGMTWIDPSWMYSYIRSKPDLTIAWFAEKGWHGTQDCYFIMRRPLSHWYNWDRD